MTVSQTASITLRVRPICARMPAADRISVLAAPEYLHVQLVELWDAADRNERKVDSPKVITAEEQDALDEKLVKRVTAGEYGADAKSALAECADQMTTATGRRAFLRSARRAVEVTRLTEAR